MNKSKNNENVKNISVLIPDAEDWLTLKALRCIGQESTFKNHLLSKKKMPLSRFCRYSTSYHYNTSQNDEEWIDEINKLISKLHIDVIMPVTVPGVELISKNRSKISESARIPPIAEPEKISLTNDKWAFHNFLLQHDLPSIPTIYVGNSGENIDISEVDSIAFPALLKPASESGGYGIVRVENKNDIERAWHDKHMMKNHDYILQSFLPADHYSYSICAREGEILAYTLYKSLLHSNPYRIGVLQEFKKDDNILNIGRKLISDLKWSGIGNIDFLVDKRDKSARILEFNPRFWQSLIGSENAGINFPALWCREAMGLKSSYINRDCIFASPSMYIKTIFDRFKGKRNNTDIRWKESGFKFTYNDPMPEVVDMFDRIGKKLKRLCVSK
ncbi:MAG: ATP-grasp domain-containing protein [Sedimentisphaerales bacterium]|nr:ATP-grasp domain-containing protein [Sedimentisphaerales bacterium]